MRSIKKNIFAFGKDPLRNTNLAVYDRVYTVTRPGIISGIRNIIADKIYEFCET